MSTKHEEGAHTPNQLMHAFAYDKSGNFAILLRGQRLSCLCHDRVQNGSFRRFEKDFRQSELVIGFVDIKRNQQRRGEGRLVHVFDERIVDCAVVFLVQCFVGHTRRIPELQHFESLDQTTATQLMLDNVRVPLLRRLALVWVDAAHKIWFRLVEILHECANAARKHRHHRLLLVRFRLFDLQQDWQRRFLHHFKRVCMHTLCVFF
mmetsp:Transcript_379/g.675  ORF Transcript_379/g.675 Transcript_379/m.675 type:complete len:206 (-) Transcript_379:1341-1958(-)